MSSHAAKYIGQFTDAQGRDVKVTIKEDGFGGSSSTVQMSGNALQIGLESEGDTKYERLKPIVSRIGIFSHTRFEFSDIFTSNDREYIAEIEYDDVLQYKQYLLPDVYNEPYRDGPYSVFFNGHDGIETLDQDHDFSGLTTGHEVLFGGASTTGVFEDLGFGLPLYDASYIYPDGADTTESALNQVQFHADRWVNSDGTAFSLKQVLDAVLSSQACFLRMEGGYWHIVPFELAGKTYTRTEYNSSGVKQSQASFDPTVNANRSELQEGSWRTQNQNMRMMSARKNIEVDNDIGSIGNLVTSGNFDWDDFDRDISGAPTVPTGWTDNGLSFGVIATDLEGTDAYINLTSGVTSGAGVYLSVQDKELSPQSGDKLSTKFKFRYLQGSGPGIANLRFALRVGTKWLSGPAGSYSWADTLTLISVQTAGVETGGAWSEIEIETPEIPVSGELEFRIYNYQVRFEGGQMNIARWVTNYLVGDTTSKSRFTTKINRDINANATPVEYSLIHGDAPASISPGALFFGGNLTSNWNRYEGGVSQNDDESLRNIIARVLAQMHQSPARKINGTLRGDHSWINALSDQSKTLIPVGGSYDVRSSTYTGEWVQFFTGTLAETIVEEFERETATFDGSGTGQEDIIDELFPSSIGTITEDLDGSYTTIPVNLNSPIRVGIDYYIVDTIDRELWAITPEDPDWDGVDLDTRVNTYGPGLLEGANELPIQEQIINAPEGSFIIIQGGQDDTEKQFPEFDFVNTTLEIAERQLNATMDLIAQGVSFGKGNTTVIDTATGNIILAEVTGDLDDVDDGANYGKVNITSISAGNILLAQASGDLDDLSDGTNFQRVASTQLTAGGIVLLSVASGDLDDISNGTNFGRVNIINIDAGTGKITLVDAIGDIDDISDGSTYSRIKATEVSAGKIVLVSNGNNIKLDATNNIFSIQSATFGNTGIQLDYNGGTPRAHIGTATTYFQFDGTNVNIEGADLESNFTAGTSGWQITSGGDVEFNSGTFRGTVNAANITGSNNVTGTLAGTGFSISSSGITITTDIEIVAAAPGFQLSQVTGATDPTSIDPDRIFYKSDAGVSGGGKTAYPLYWVD